MNIKTPFLDKVNFPKDFKKFSLNELKSLSEDLRKEVIDAVSETGGHLGAGLGVVELTVALHKIFDTPKDKLIWDVGHQCYPHKIITGRRDRIRTIIGKNYPCILGLISHPRYGEHWVVVTGYNFTSHNSGTYTVNDGWGNVGININSSYTDGGVDIG